MRVRVLGSGAAEGIPAMYCRCTVCREAESNGGRSVRGRTSLLIDGTLKIDYGPDTYAQRLAHNVDMMQVTDVVVTHSHEDHFSPTEFIWRGANFIQDGKLEPMCVYGNTSVVDLFDLHCARYGCGREDLFRELRMDFAEMVPFQPSVVGEYTIHPIRATHEPRQVALNYVIEKDRRRLLVGFDTSWYSDESWDYLTKRFAANPIDCVLMDCTMGALSGGTTHLGFDDNLRVRSEMLRRCVISDTTRYILTHISHGGKWSHAEYVNRATDVGMEVAYDGLETEV
jgi:phosphoribosyl 1,2-cyclic phosphate phosphodiesterase